MLESQIHSDNALPSQKNAPIWRKKMKIEIIETQRLYLRGFIKHDARFAISIWNDHEMGEYLPDSSIENIEEEYLKSVELLGG